MHQVPGERLQGAIHKRRHATGQLFNPKQDGVVQHGAGSQVAIAAEGRFRASPKQQFVTMHLTAQVQDRLARHVAQSIGQLQRCGT